MTDPRDKPETYEQKFISDHEDLVARVQKLVDQYHTLSKDVAHVSDKIPELLDKRIIRIELQLEQIIKDVEEEFVSRTEFEVLKVEHVQIRRLVYGFVGMALISIISGLLAMVVHNGAAIVR